MSRITDYDLLDYVGKGTFGVVYRARRKYDQQIYCLKQINLQGASQNEINAAARECYILALINSPYVIRYYDSFVDSEAISLWIVMEYASKGTLRELILRYDIDEEQAWYFITQMVLGIATLHVNHIIHRDIKSLNVFVTEEPGGRLALKIGDLGVSKQLNYTMQLAQTVVGSPYYLSPEICKSSGYNIKSDVWALGVTFYEMLSHGRHPFYGGNQGALIYNIIRGKYQKSLDESKYSVYLRHFVYWCLTPEVSSRPNTFSLITMKTIYEVIQRYSFPFPEQLQQNVYKEKNNMKSKQSQRGLSGKKAEQARPTVSQPTYQREVKEIMVTQNEQKVQTTGFLIIEEDVISVTPSQKQDLLEIKEYDDDFDEEETTEQNDTKSNEIDQLMKRYSEQKYQLDSLQKQLLKFHIKPNLQDEMIRWIIYNGAATDQEVQKYVLKKLPIEKEKAIGLLQQYAHLKTYYETDAMKLQEMLKEMQ